MEIENDVDGYSDITKRCFLRKQLKPKALERHVNKRGAMRNILILVVFIVPRVLLSSPIDTVWSNTYDQPAYKLTYKMIRSGNMLVGTSGYNQTGLWSINSDGSPRYSHLGQPNTAGKALYPLSGDSLLLVCSSGFEPEYYIGIHTVTPDGSIIDSTYISTPGHYFIVAEIDRFSNGDFVVAGADDTHQNGYPKA